MTPPHLTGRMIHIQKLLDMYDFTGLSLDFLLDLFSNSPGYSARIVRLFGWKIPKISKAKQHDDTKERTNRK